MRAYQTLALAGGTLGTTGGLAAFVITDALSAVSEAFGGDPADIWQTQLQAAVSVAPMVVTTVLPFVLGNLKVLGRAMIAMAIAVVIATSAFGPIGAILLPVGGTMATRYEEAATA